MQNVELASHNRIEIKEQSRLGIGGVVLSIAFLFFAFIGAYDIFSRFAGGGTVTSSDRDVTNTSAIQNPTNQLSAISSASTSPILPAPFVPESLVIPEISINTRVQSVGQTPAGLMANPKGFKEVAWYKLGSKPGEAGNTVIAGHLNNALGMSGVFERLGDLSLGSEITIKGEGREITYVVRELHVYATKDAPVERIFARSGPSTLVLITCDGAWDTGVKSYDKRLIVIADPK